MYERHIDGISAALKTGRRTERTERDERGEIVRVHPAHDYEPAQAWVVVKDGDGVLQFHHEQTDALLKLIVPQDSDSEDEVATLYKVRPNAQRDNVRANQRISAAAVRRGEAAIKSGELQRAV